MVFLFSCFHDNVSLIFPSAKCKRLCSHAHIHSCHRPSHSPKYFHPVCMHTGVQGTVHPCPPSLLSICNRPRLIHWYSNTAKPCMLKRSSGPDVERRKGRRGEEKRRREKWSSVTGPLTSQQQVLTTEALGFTAVGMGLTKAPESGLCFYPRGLKGERSLPGLTKARSSEEVMFESLTPQLYKGAH